MAKRVFVAFAIEDKLYRDLLKGQSLNTNSPFEYVDFSVKEPWDTAWKERVRSRIRSCDGTVALLSKNTLSASGAKFEIRASLEEGKPVLGLFIHDDDRSRPSELGNSPSRPWTWESVANFIDSI